MLHLPGPDTHSGNGGDTPSVGSLLDPNPSLPHLILVTTWVPQSKPPALRRHTAPAWPVPGFNLAMEDQEIFVSKPNKALFPTPVQGEGNLQERPMVSGTAKEREIKSNSLIFVK